MGYGFIEGKSPDTLEFAEIGSRSGKLNRNLSPSPAHAAGWLLAAILWFTAQGPEAFAQINRCQFTRFTTNDGLPDNNVHRIIQDAQGYLWFGTANGLCRYDGYEFTVFKHRFQDSRSLSDNFVNALLADSRGRIWAGTQNGLNLFDPATNTFQTFLTQTGEAPPSPANFITVIFEDVPDGLWIGTTDGFCVLIRNRGSSNGTLTIRQIRSRFRPTISRRFFVIRKTRSGSAQAAGD